MMLSTLIVLMMVGWSIAENPTDARFSRQTISLPSDVPSISVIGSFDLYLIPTINASNNRIEIEGTGQYSFITTIYIHPEVDGTQTLNIIGRSPDPPRASIRIYFNAPLRRLTYRGRGNLFTEGDGIVNSDPQTFTLEIVGMVHGLMQFNVSRFFANIIGEHNVQCQGIVRDLAQFDIRGTNQVDASALVSRMVEISTRGGNVVKVAATDDLHIFSEGTGSVSYQMPKGKKPSLIHNFGTVHLQQVE